MMQILQLHSRNAWFAHVHDAAATGRNGLIVNVIVSRIVITAAVMEVYYVAAYEHVYGPASHQSLLLF